VGIRDLEWEKLLAENSDGDILKQNISKHLLDLIKAAYDLGWHDCAQQSKGSADQQTNNSDYTKCADEVLSIINFSRDSSHGRKIIECIKRHFA